MTSRRLLRIKALHILYSYKKKENISLTEIERDLLKSIEKSSDLYYLVFLLLTEIQRKSFLKADSAKNKHFATEEELNPNTRFIENPLFSTIENNRYFKSAVKNRLLSWQDTPEIIDSIYTDISNSDLYKEYMMKEKVTFQDHKDMTIAIFTDFIINNELLLQALEDKNIFWNDDFQLIFLLVYKTLKNIKSNTQEDDNFFFQVYKGEEDINFAKDLLLKSILDYEKNIDIINLFIKNWEVDRLSEVDKYIMVIAATELKHFPSIPVKVTLDEYIEISKSYSSSKSRSFINGVLDKVVGYLKEKGEMQKAGRGLME